ncbi:MAG: hypothetical protein JOY71_28280, partial [Acetobacteraceae bacterium]|nr:hypothetical protein [Acetobacteraceae bacterium]
GSAAGLPVSRNRRAQFETDSSDLRTRVVAAAAGGQTCRQIARVFSMAVERRPAYNRSVASIIAVPILG